MKKLNRIALLMLLILTTFTSCTKDISGPVDLDLAEGKWIFSRSTVSARGITLPYTNDYFKNEDGCTKDYIQILSGNIVKYGDYPANCVLVEKEGTWSLDGNNLAIAVTNSSVNAIFEIVSLTTTELILQINGTYEGQTGTLTLYFAK